MNLLRFFPDSFSGQGQNDRIFIGTKENNDNLFSLYHPEPVFLPGTRRILKEMKIPVFYTYCKTVIPHKYFITDTIIIPDKIHTEEK